MRVLLVEDDRTMSLLARRLLEEEGFAVDTAETAENGRVLAMVNDYDAIVLDLMLPDGNGVPVIQELRRAGRDVPVVVLTGTADKSATVRALDAGADDYLTKPFVFDEFKARMRALVRRGGARRTEQVTVGNVLLNRLAHTVRVNGAALTLAPRELRLLEHLLLRSGVVVTRSELLDKVWDMNFDPGSNVVDVNVARLRKKLGAAGASVEIVARRGLGFVLDVAPESTLP